MRGIQAAFSLVVSYAPVWVVAMSLLGPAHGAAQENAAESIPPEPRPGFGSELSFEALVFHDSDARGTTSPPQPTRNTTVAQVTRARAVLAPGFVAEVQFGLAIDERRNDQRTLEIHRSNIVVAFDHRWHRNLTTVRVGGAVALPTATGDPEQIPLDAVPLPGVLTFDLANRRAAALSAMRRSGLYAVDTLTLTMLRSAFRTDVDDFALGAELDLHLHLAVQDRQSPQVLGGGQAFDTLRRLQPPPRRDGASGVLSGWFGGRPIPALLVGAEVAAVLLEGEVAGEAFDWDLLVVADAFVELQAGVFRSRLTLSVPLTGPLGFAFEDDGTWALGLSLGALFGD